MFPRCMKPLAVKRHLTLWSFLTFSTSLVSKSGGDSPRAERGSRAGTKTPLSTRLRYSSTRAAFISSGLHCSMVLLWVPSVEGLIAKARRGLKIYVDLKMKQSYLSPLLVVDQLELRWQVRSLS